MQYKTGTVAVNNGSNVVTGSGTLWLANISAGHIFTVQGSGVWYQVSSVVDNDTLWLTSNYGGSNDAAAVYAVTTDFTANYGFPYPVKGDVDTASIVARALQEIDTRIKALDDLVASLHP